MNEQTVSVDSVNSVENADSADIVSKPIKLFWGTGALGVAVLMNSISTLILFYMVGVLKIEPALAGALIFATKILDVISDPVVGIWSDRIKTPIGRRRPFLMWGAVISSASIAMIFTTPMFEHQVFTVIYIFTALLIYTVGYTVFNVPYMAMPAEMTNSYHERSSIHSYRVVFVMIGGFLAGGLGNFFLEEMGRTDWSSYAVLGIAGAVIVFVTMTITYFGTARAKFTESGHSVPNVMGDLSAISANKHFLRLIGVKACQLLAISATGSAMLFFITSSLQLDLKVLAYFFVVITLVSVISAPVMVRISKRIGKRSTYMIAAVCYVLYSISWVFAVPGESLSTILLRGVVVGVAATGNILLAMSMLTDTIEYDTVITGERREGAYTAIYSFVEKLTHAFGPLIVGIAMSLAGFDKTLSSEEMQSPSVQQALLFGVAYLPVILGVLAMAILAGFKLDEKALAELKGGDNA